MIRLIPGDRVIVRWRFYEANHMAEATVVEAKHKWVTVRVDGKQEIEYRGERRILWRNPFTERFPLPKSKAWSPRYGIQGMAQPKENTHGNQENS